MQKSKFILPLIVLFLVGCQGQTNSKKQPISFVDTARSFRKEIPTFSDGKIDLFYLLAKDKQTQLGLDIIENGFNNLQIRVWYDYSRVIERKLVIITNKDSAWTATVYNLKVNWDGETETIISKQVRQVTPKSGWVNFAEKLMNLKIVTLPTMNSISGYEGGKDGKMFNVEIASKNQYRFYSYWEPQVYQDKFWQAKNIAELLDLFRTELNVEI